VVTVLSQSLGFSPGLGGLYSLEWLTINRCDVNTPLRSYVPSTTTPIPSRNICGGTSVEETSTDAAPGPAPSATLKLSRVCCGSHWMLPRWTTPPRRMVVP